MGARATIRIIHPTSDTPIHLYTHWRGDDITEILAEGLQKALYAGRINDYSYATRIIFDTLTLNEGGETGFGICIGDDGQPDDVEFATPTVQWFGNGQIAVFYESMTFTVDQFIAVMNNHLTAVS